MKSPKTIKFDGLFFSLWRYGKNDYSLWITDDLKDESSGSSSRGTFEEVTSDYKELFPTPKNL